jgi:uncharacterized protein with von Willebrand factor type A (vWA) domain
MIADFTKDVPLEWLRKNLELELSPEEKAKIEKMGWDELMETLKKRFEEQKERHEGGNKWIGTGGTSPLAPMAQPAGHPHRPGQGPQQERGEGLGPARLQGLRRPAGTGHAQHQGGAAPPAQVRARGHEDELDLDDTIRCTAANAGWLDIKMVPERHNNVKVLLLMDVGGTMDEHIQRVEEMFSAAKTEFKHLEFYYFHNCVYDFMWKNNRRRFSEKFPPGTSSASTTRTTSSSSSATRR